MSHALVLFASIVNQGYADSVADLWRSFYSQVCGCVGFIVFVLGVVGLWKMYVKAGENGWAAIIPIYNIWVLLRIVGRPGWWLILFFIPIVQIVVWVLVALDVAKAFDKSTAYGVGIIFFQWLFFLILGFGDAKYFGPGGPAAG